MCVKFKDSILNISEVTGISVAKKKTFVAAKCAIYVT